MVNNQGRKGHLHLIPLKLKITRKCYHLVPWKQSTRLLCAATRLKLSDTIENFAGNENNLFSSPYRHQPGLHWMTTEQWHSSTATLNSDVFTISLTAQKIESNAPFLGGDALPALILPVRVIFLAVRHQTVIQFLRNTQIVPTSSPILDLYKVFKILILFYFIY